MTTEVYQNEGSNVKQDELECGHVSEDGAEILDEMVKEIRRHVMLTDHCAAAVALWILHAHSADAHQHSPRLHIQSPVLGCGKTTLMSIIAALSGPRAEMISNLSIAAFFRYVSGKKPTPIMVIDEVETFRAEDRKEAIGILNSGHNRAGAYILRCKSADEGFAPDRFCTWAPLALASIGPLPPTLESRSIVVNLMRKRSGERVERFLHGAQERCGELAKRAEAWCAAVLPALSEADPELPACLYNRAQDNWRPLLAIADRAGGHSIGKCPRREHLGHSRGARIGKH